ncbi:uncharacterized protein [Temnothorax nylanderi]|uniref:uncharacterized protein n=1 Tax=Temnothorax nylanderi TaxID=102681 RepID=UPI003A89DA7B
MAYKILQGNLNHCRASQDVFLHTIAERGSGLGVIAEPYRVPPSHTCWAASRCGRAAITWRMTNEPVLCSRLEAGNGVLDSLRDCLEKYLPYQQVLVAGDFNAKSALWGSPATDRRGGIFMDWAASLGLVCVNTGAVQTCWIEMSLPVTTPEIQARRREIDLRFPRWSLRKLDKEWLRASLRVSLWTDDQLDLPEDVDEAAAWIGEAMTRACDAAMPRSRPHPRRHAYWWTEEIAEFRRSSVHARRIWLRERRKRNPQRLEKVGEEYRSAKRALSRAIKVAKDHAWKELLEETHREPWGRPYKMVLNKLRTWAPPTTEAMDPEFLEEVVDTLFPDDPGERVNGGPPPSGGVE